MTNTTLYVEKREGFKVEAQALIADLKNNLTISVNELRCLNVYDVFNIEENVLVRAKANIFAEPMVDEVYEELDTCGYTVIAYEPLPGQYDQRSDSAQQALRLLNPSSIATVKSGHVVLLKGNLSESDVARIKKHLINPIESREKQLGVRVEEEKASCAPLATYPRFIEFNQEELKQFREELGLAMSLADVEHIQRYFRDEEHRNPTETEIRVLDTYWSDHCRHTTFETCLNSITIHESSLSEDIQNAYNLYLQMRECLGRNEKPQTLMDMACIAGRYGKHTGTLTNLEVSDEINACSVYMNVEHNGETEQWLLMFKNETHNHPTEIEPFGGASTCIGGAIRDPLSGRSYVYQAMRISGCGNVLTPLSETLENKLPQSVIAAKATAGNSSYGNQIGLPTTYVREIYHPNYVAKHMEVGAVVGANKVENVQRLTSEPGNKIILLGGRTGRDGIGGATGSSKEHNEKSLEVCASEVQKGNAVEERKIQRLFRNAEVSHMIRKCNDFGAGGVCVAIGELADGLRIHLDRVRVKYEGLNATEIAISESQERMAVVVDASDVEKFIAEAQKENLEAYEVAEVTSDNRLVILMNDEKVVDINRDFINTNGAKQYAEAEVKDSGMASPFTAKAFTKESFLETLSSLNVASQKGLKETFDASIGSTTILMPYSGKYQLTPTQASVQKVPVLDGKTNTCSILTYGFNPYISEYSPYLGSSYAVIESIAKLVACGGTMKEAYASYQEYFERLGSNTESWGKVVQALLGTVEAQEAFHIYSIGGKDSMSGTFKDIHVPPTLISFTCGVGNTKNIISNEFKAANHHLYLVNGKHKENYKPIYESYVELYEKVEELIMVKKILSANVVEMGGVASELVKMGLGNGIGAEVKVESPLAILPGAIIVETSEELNEEGFEYLGKTVERTHIQINEVEVSLEEALQANQATLNGLYKIYGNYEDKKVTPSSYFTTKKWESKVQVEHPYVFIPVFPGTNCEYDMARAFEEEGAQAHIFVFANQTKEMLEASIDGMVEHIKQANIIAIPGGFSSGDEPDGSAKFIVNVLLNEKVKNAIHEFLDKDGLMLGICNGFQALIKSGLLPYGRIQEMNEAQPTLFRNNINRHISTFVTTRVGSNNSPWLADMEVGELHKIPVSHGEGKFVCSDSLVKELFERGCVAFQYCDLEGNPVMDSRYNVNGSLEAIEGIVSMDGRILGKMGHSERFSDDTFQNIEGNKKQSIFRSGVRYFTHK